MATTHPPPPWTETHKKIKEKFISKLTRNQTHYHCEAPEIKPKTHPEFTPHCEAHDAGLTKPHAHAVPTSTSNLAPVACLKEEDRDVRKGVRMRTKIESEEKKKKRRRRRELSVHRSPHRAMPNSNPTPVAGLKEEDEEM